MRGVRSSSEARVRVLEFHTLKLASKRSYSTLGFKFRVSCTVHVRFCGREKLIHIVKDVCTCTCTCTCICSALQLKSVVVRGKSCVGGTVHSVGAVSAVAGCPLRMTLSATWTASTAG